METPGPFELAFSAGVLIVAYAIRGATGFGGPAIAVPLLALVMPLQLFVPAIVILTAFSAIGQLCSDWHRIAWTEIRRLLPASVAGMLVGLYLLQRVDIRFLLKGFGGFVVLYGCFAFATASRPVRLPGRMLVPAGMLLGAVAGVLGATFGAAAGPLYVIYLSARGLERDAFRVTISTILTVLAVLLIVGYFRLGFLGATTLALVTAGLPLMVLGTALGHWLARRLDQRWFNVAVSLLLLVSGTALMFK